MLNISVTLGLVAWAFGWTPRAFAHALAADPQPRRIWRDALPLFRMGGEFSAGPKPQYGGLNYYNYTVPPAFAGSVLNLQPDTEYEARVQAQTSGYRGAYSEIVKFRTWPIQPSHCGADEDDPSIPEADNDRPLLNGVRGMLIQLDDLEMQLVEVVHLGQGWYSGTGRTRVKFLGNGNFPVKFERLYIDEDRVAGDGRVDFITHGTVALIEQQMQNVTTGYSNTKALPSTPSRWRWVIRLRSPTVRDR